MLGTGTGKTFIAKLLIVHYSDQLNGSYHEKKAKRTFFLVPNRPLAYQQASEIDKHMKLEELPFNVKRITGEMDVDNWDLQDWDLMLEPNHIIVMTGQILLNMLNDGFITFDDINLLIFDEVHWAAKKKGKKDTGHPYKEIMNQYLQWSEQSRPRVLGLSATPINCSMNIYGFEDAIADIENTYCAVCKTGDAGNYGTNPEEIIWEFRSDSNCRSIFSQQVVVSLENFIVKLKECDTKMKKKYKNYTGQTNADKIKRCLSDVKNMLKSSDENSSLDNLGMSMTTDWMGTWCASVCVKKIIEELIKHKELYAEVDPKQAEMFDHVIRYLRFIKAVLSAEIQTDPNSAFNTASPKMHRLLKILDQYSDPNKI